MEYTESEKRWIWLSSISGMTPKRFYKLLSVCEDPVSVWEDPGEFREDMGEALFAEVTKARNAEACEAYFYGLEKLGITAVARSSDLYPKALDHIHDAPPVLYIKGRVQIETDKGIGVVGTRNPTYDGQKAAREFSRGLAENGAVIVSGLARGIDTLAHTGCLEGKGRTLAVLGNGLAGVYPSENLKLAERILENGGSLISEMRPHDSPTRWSFPQRNRIISGLSCATLVVEGSMKSGAMITANFALEEGKDVFAVPGSPFNPNAEGTNHLIQNGAYPALSHWDILEALHWKSRPGKAKAAKPAVPELDDNERMVYNALKTEPKSFDELISVTNVSAACLNSCLTMLLLRGIIIKLPGNIYRLA